MAETIQTQVVRLAADFVQREFGEDPIALKGIEPKIFLRDLGNRVGALSDGHRAALQKLLKSHLDSTGDRMPDSYDFARRILSQAKHR